MTIENKNTIAHTLAEKLDGKPQFSKWLIQEAAESFGGCNNYCIINDYLNRTMHRFIFVDGSAIVWETGYRVFISAHESRISELEVDYDDFVRKACKLFSKFPQSLHNRGNVYYYNATFSIAEGTFSYLSFPKEEKK